MYAPAADLARLTTIFASRCLFGLSSSSSAKTGTAAVSANTTISAESATTPSCLKCLIMFLSTGWSRAAVTGPEPHEGRLSVLLEGDNKLIMDPHRFRPQGKRSETGRTLGWQRTRPLWRAAMQVACSPEVAKRIPGVIRRNLSCRPYPPGFASLHPGYTAVTRPPAAPILHRIAEGAPGTPVALWPIGSEHRG